MVVGTDSIWIAGVLKSMKTLDDVSEGFYSQGHAAEIIAPDLRALER
jgi:hypothetical protein